MSRYFCIAILAVAALLAADKGIAPIPNRVITAKTVRLVDRAADPKVIDRLYEKLSAWGRWKVVDADSPADLDLVYAERDLVYATLSLIAPDGTSLIGVSIDKKISPGSTANGLVKRIRERIERAAK